MKTLAFILFALSDKVHARYFEELGDSSANAPEPIILILMALFAYGYIQSNGHSAQSYATAAAAAVLMWFVPAVFYVVGLLFIIALAYSLLR